MRFSRCKISQHEFRYLRKPEAESSRILTVEGYNIPVASENSCKRWILLRKTLLAKTYYFSIIKALISCLKFKSIYFFKMRFCEKTHFVLRWTAKMVERKHYSFKASYAHFSPLPIAEIHTSLQTVSLIQSMELFLPLGNINNVTTTGVIPICFWNIYTYV